MEYSGKHQFAKMNPRTIKNCLLVKKCQLLAALTYTQNVEVKMDTLYRYFLKVEVYEILPKTRIQRIV